MREQLSRLVCAYCGDTARPNSYYCMSCGQILQARPPAKLSAPRTATEAPATSPPAPRVGEIEGLPEALQTTQMSRMLPAFDSPPDVEPHDDQAEGAEQPRAALPPVGLADRHQGALQLSFSTGQVVRVSHGTVIGRKPHATARNAGLDAAEVHDDAMSLSRAHAIVEVTDRSARITDLGSSNGTEIERGHERELLVPEKRYRLQHGDRIWLGTLTADVSIDVLSEKGRHGGQHEPEH